MHPRLDFARLHSSHHHMGATHTRPDEAGAVLLGARGGWEVRGGGWVGGGGWGGGGRGGLSAVVALL